MQTQPQQAMMFSNRGKQTQVDYGVNNATNQMIPDNITDLDH